MKQNQSQLNIVKTTISIVLALICGTALHKYFILSAKDLFSFVLYPFLYYLFMKVDFKFEKRLGMISLITTLILVFTQIYGGWISWLFTQNTIPTEWGIYFDIGIISVGLIILGYLMIYKLLEECRVISIVNIKMKCTEKKMIFLIAFSIILLCWIPLYFIAYPGIVTPDSLAQIKIINGDSLLSDHHPIIHTAIIGVFYKLGYFLFNSHNGAVGTAIFVQMTLMCSIFAYSISYLYNKKVRLPYLIAILLFYALSPIHAFYNMTLWKDVLFSGITLLLAISIYELVYQSNDKNISKKDWFIFSLTATGFVLLRNNGIYAYLFLMIFMYYFLRKQIRYVIPYSLLPLIMYILIKGPVFSALGVQPGHTVEALSIPLQQMGYLAKHQDLLAEEEKELLNKIAPVESMGDLYLPYLSDPIKNLIRDNSEYPSLVHDKVEFIKVWVKLGLRYPRAYIRSYAYQTLGYWYMDVDYWVILDEIVPNDYGIERESNEKVEELSEWLEGLKDETPLVSALWSVGLVCITTFGLIVFNIVKRQYNLLTVFSVSVGIWITIMISTPVNAEFRYIYALYTILPFLMAITFIKQIKK